MQRQIRRAYLKLVFLTRGKTNGVAKLLGFRIHYCSQKAFKYLFHEVFIALEYQFNSTSQKPFIIDCGSNIGMSVLFFKWIYPASKVICFEPDRDAFDCLKKNVEVNDLTNVTLHQKAVFNHDGSIDFWTDPKNPGTLKSSVVEERSPLHRETVDSTRLSNFITEPVSFLKLDIEGAELVVIEELSEAKKLGMISQICIEYHHHIENEIDNLSLLLQLLERESFGYQVSGFLSRPFKSKAYQDITIYAYNKRG